MVPIHAQKRKEAFHQTFPIAKASRLRVRRASRSTKVRAAKRRPNFQPWTAALRQAGSRSALEIFFATAQRVFP
jgi:hypothetical protein